mmetsp:Transcript_29510/g.57893  ORF Transcript_29510/g.57893 Transcript_29510/m.57893 type:complete len:350 (-) Transcript_29510:58-1107(-)
MPLPPDISSDDYYKLLGVDRSASDNEVAKAYKKLALKYHPDKNPDDKENAEQIFKVITEAYEVLREPEKRKAYDQFGKRGVQAGADGSDGETGGGVSFQHADELFRAFFSGTDPFCMHQDDDDRGFFLNGGGLRGGSGMVFRTGMSRAGGGMPRGMFDAFGALPGTRFQGSGRDCKHAQQSVPPMYTLPRRTTVVIRHLTQSQEYNGKIGRISGWDGCKGRYKVELEGSTSLSMRPSNLTQQCQVQVVGIESQPELNGQFGTILNYQAQQERYQVRLKVRMANGKEIVGLHPSHIILERGTRVVIQGLTNEQFNGQMAQIVDIDQDAGRYTVQCQSGKTIKIKFGNVLC